MTDGLLDSIIQLEKRIQDEEYLEGRYMAEKDKSAPDRQESLDRLEHRGSLYGLYRPNLPPVHG